MNRKEHLIAETLGDGDGEPFALLAASRARRRRVIRQATLASGASFAAIAALLVVRQPQVQPPAVAPAPSPILEIISDQELMVHLKDRPVLLLKDKDRITKVVFLADKESPKNTPDRARF